MTFFPFPSNLQTGNLFAAGVNREDIERGAADLGVPLTKHIEIVLSGMKEIAGELGL